VAVNTKDLLGVVTHMDTHMYTVHVPFTGYLIVDVQSDRPLNENRVLEKAVEIGKTACIHVEDGMEDTVLMGGYELYSVETQESIFNGALTKAVIVQTN